MLIIRIREQEQVAVDAMVRCPFRRLHSSGVKLSHKLARCIMNSVVPARRESALTLLDAVVIITVARALTIVLH